MNIYYNYAQGMFGHVNGGSSKNWHDRQKKIPDTMHEKKHNLFHSCFTW